MRQPVPGEDLTIDHSKDSRVPDLHRKRKIMEETQEKLIEP
jgi:hypothetical protein